MSAETITTALFLITAVVASAVLINAVYPVIQTMAGTFSSSTHESDVRIRTDFKIITTYATTGTPGTVQVWMKNIGTERISIAQIQQADVFCGSATSYNHLAHTSGSLGNNQWIEDFSVPEYDQNNNQFWDPGETLKVTAKTTIPSSGSKVTFQFALPNGIWRSNEFTAS
jgi:flagellar protein FlaG